MKKGNFMLKVLLMLIAGIFLSVGAFAQQITVKGMVKDATGEPVIGANVVVKGTTPEQLPILMATSSCLPGKAT